MIKQSLLVLAFLVLAGCAAKTDSIETVFYPPLPQSPKLQFLKSISSEKDIGKETSQFKEFLLGETESFKAISRPYDIASVPGRIYISDRTFKKLLYIDLENKVFNYVRDEGPGSFDQPAGIDITASGDKYIADFGRNQIVVFDRNDTFKRAYGEPGQFSKPLDVAVYGNRLYVADYDLHQVTVVDMESGKSLYSIGGSGTEEGKMHRPTHIRIDIDGNLYVTDSFNFRVQKFTPEGKFEKQFGYQGDTLGGFARPKGIAVDRDGFVYAADMAFENVQIFENKSALLALFFGGFGPNPGSMYLPNSVYIDYANVKYFQQYVDNNFKINYLVYVGNMLGDHKLNVYGFGDWTGSQLPDVPRQRIKLD